MGEIPFILVECVKINGSASFQEQKRRVSTALWVDILEQIIDQYFTAFFTERCWVRQLYFPSNFEDISVYETNPEGNLESIWIEMFY